MDRITSADVMGVLLPIWSAKHTTAKRVQERIGTVMKWAIAQGYQVDNPAGEAIRAALPKPGRVQKHLKALPYEEVAGAIEAIRRSGARVSVKLALEFLALTALPVRGGARGSLGRDRPGGRGVGDSCGADQECWRGAVPPLTPATATASEACAKVAHQARAPLA